MWNTQSQYRMIWIIYLFSYIFYSHVRALRQSQWTMAMPLPTYVGNAIFLIHSYFLIINF